LVNAQDKRFKGFITTNGVWVGVLMSRPKRAHEQEPAKMTTDEEVYAWAKRMWDAADRRVGLDPGRNPLLTGVVHDEEATKQLKKARNKHHEVIKMSAPQWHHETGHNDRLNAIKAWTAANETIQRFNEGNTTAKTADVEKHALHARHGLKYIVPLLAFYGAEYQQLNWNVYIRTQKTYAKLGKALKGNAKHTLVVYGAAGFPAHGRGSRGVPVKGMRRKIAAMEGSTVVLQDEFRTSKQSACCRTELKKGRVPSGRTPWTLRVCPQANCFRSNWERNVSAALNILFLFWCKVQGRKPHRVFHRKKLEEDAVAAGPEAENNDNNNNIAEDYDDARILELMSRTGVQSLEC